MLHSIYMPCELRDGYDDYEGAQYTVQFSACPVVFSFWMGAAVCGGGDLARCWEGFPGTNMLHMRVFGACNLVIEGNVM